MVPVERWPDLVQSVSAAAATSMGGDVGSVGSLNVDVGARSSTGRPSAATSQLMPMMGMATSAQATVSEQPSDAFWSEVWTTNLELPVPSRPVTAKVSLLGNVRFPRFCTASGGWPAHPFGPPG